MKFCYIAFLWTENWNVDGNRNRLMLKVTKVQNYFSWIVIIQNLIFSFCLRKDVNTHLYSLTLNMFCLESPSVYCNVYLFWRDKIHLYNKGNYNWNYCKNSYSVYVALCMFISYFQMKTRIYLRSGLYTGFIPNEPV